MYTVLEKYPLYSDHSVKRLSLLAVSIAREKKNTNIALNVEIRPFLTPNKSILNRGAADQLYNSRELIRKLSKQVG
jgi:hypothetical protein